MAGRLLQLKSVENDSIFFSSLLDLCDSEIICVGDVEIICGDGKTVYLHKIVFNFAFPQFSEVLPNGDGKIVIIVPGCDFQTIIEARNTLYLDGLTKPLETILEQGFGSQVTKEENSEVDDEISFNCKAPKEIKDDQESKTTDSESMGDWVTMESYTVPNPKNNKNEVANCNLTIKNDPLAINNTNKLIKHTINIFNQTIDYLGKDLDNIPIDELPDAISTFFTICVKADGSPYNSSSLNTYYHMISQYLRLRDNDPVDISIDERFKKCAEAVKARCIESVKSGNIAGINASHSLTSEELQKLMDSEAMSRNNPRGLISLVNYILMTGFGCKARDKCRAITNRDIIYGPDAGVTGLPEYLSLSERIVINRLGFKTELDRRIYLDLDNPTKCPVRTIVHYQMKKTKKQLAPDFPFLLTVKQAALKDPLNERYWYIDHAMGVNYIGTLFRKAIEAAGLDLGNKKISASSALKTYAESKQE